MVLLTAINSSFPNTPPFYEKKVLLFVISSYLAATYKNKRQLSLIRLKASFVVYTSLTPLVCRHIYIWITVYRKSCEESEFTQSRRKEKSWWWLCVLYYLSCNLIVSSIIENYIYRKWNLRHFQLFTKFSANTAARISLS